MAHACALFEIRKGIELFSKDLKDIELEEIK